MAMTFGCCIGSSCYDLVAKAGYSSIAFPGVELTSLSESEFEQLTEKVRTGPLDVLSVNSFCPPQLRLTGHDLDLDALERYARILFPRAAQLGVKFIGIGGPVSRSTREGETQEDALRNLETSLSTLCRVAEEYSLTILLESVCSLECNLVTYTHEAAEMVRRLNIPNLGLVYDIYHAHMMHEDPRYILEAADLIRVAHIAQDEGGKRIYLREEKFQEYLPYIKALTEAGYTGELNMESFVGDPAQELPQSKKILDDLLNTVQSNS